MPKAAYHLVFPKDRTTSVVFASPHSGRDYPDWFLKKTRLDPLAIRSSEDAFVDQLFATAPQTGAPFIHAGAPRAFVDLNRGRDEMDPALIRGVRPAGHNPRIASGLGVVPRVVANGQAIYTGKLSLSEAEERIDTFWAPYHETLKTQLAQSHAIFGESILLDCHSMPHEAMDSVAREPGGRPDVVLGDRFGASASSEIVDQVEAAFTKAGLRVSRNAPFAGAYIVQTYGRPSKGQHAVQIEIDRALYMDEKRVEPSANFDAFKALLQPVIVELADIGRRAKKALAAE